MALTLHHELSGREGAPVIALSHSLASNLSMWDAQMPMLLQRFRVLRFDTPGHGRSSLPPADTTIEALAAEVAQLLDALHLPAVHYLGLSLGGMIGQALALAQPQRIKSLVLADTTSAYPPEAAAMWAERAALVGSSGMAAVADVTLQRWFTAGFAQARPDVFERVRQMILNTPAAGFIACGLAIPRMKLTPRLGEITCPTLVLVGEEDHATPPAHAAVLAQGIRGARLVTLAHAAHLSAVEVPRAFNDAVAQFHGSINDAL